MKAGFVYFVTNWTGEVIYVGVTSNLEQRLAQHRMKTFSGFTGRYNLDKLVYYETFADMENAILREKQIKRWRRQKKDVLVEGVNPAWDNLFDGRMIRSLGCARDDKI